MLGISSGEEREDNSPLLKTQPLEEMPDPAQAGNIKHLWALGRSRLRRRRRRVIGLGQPGLKIETPLCDGRLAGCFSQARDGGKRQRYLNPGKSQLGQSWLLPSGLLQPGLPGRRKAMRNHSPEPTRNRINYPISLK